MKIVVLFLLLFLILFVVVCVNEPRTRTNYHSMISAVFDMMSENTNGTWNTVTNVLMNYDSERKNMTGNLTFNGTTGTLTFSNYNVSNLTTPQQILFNNEEFANYYNDGTALHFVYDNKNWIFRIRTFYDVCQENSYVWFSNGSYDNCTPNGEIQCDILSSLMCQGLPHSF